MKITTSCPSDDPALCEDGQTKRSPTRVSSTSSTKVFLRRDLECCTTLAEGLVLEKHAAQES